MILLIITTPDPQPVTYEDYDIIFANDTRISFSISADLGDTVDFDTSPLSVIFHFAEKTSATDDSAKLPSEDVTIMMQHVLSISRRTRTVTPHTKEEKDLFKQTLHQLAKSVQ